MSLVPSKKVPYLVTAPHAYCDRPPILGHTVCDDLAGKAAVILSDALREAPCVASVSTFVNDSVLRSKCDLNRNVCRNEETFRRPVRETYRMFTGKSVRARPRVLDVHSYPSVPHAWQGAPIDTTKAEVVVLDDFQRQEVKNFVSFLRTNGIDAHYLRGAHNDIMEEFHGILFEFSERLSDDRLREIMRVIARGMCTSPNLFDE